MRVAVVGGGPAGSRTAELLARQGARVTLYEARTGWEKPCGGGIPERGIEDCPFLGGSLLPQRRALRARIYSCTGREAVVPLAHPLRIFSRRELDGFLLARARGAGAEVRAVRIAGVEREGSTWRLRDAAGRSEAFDFLVGADGASGVVRGRVLGSAWPLHQTVGIGYYLEGFTADEIVLKFYRRLDGYLWIFPRTDHLAVGICGPPGGGQGEQLRGEMERFLLDLYGPAVLRRLRKYGARIPSLPPGIPARLSCQGEGWALVGDAAGFVDPLTREGIHYALFSARLLSEALSGGRWEGYGERWDETYGRELDWAARHRGLFFSPRFIEAFTLLASASPAVQEVVSDLIAGRQEYRSLRRRLAGHAPAAAGSLALRFLERFLTGRPPWPPPDLTSLAH